MFTASSHDEQGKSERSVCGERKNKTFFTQVRNAGVRWTLLFLYLCVFAISKATEY